LPLTLFVADGLRILARILEIWELEAGVQPFWRSLHQSRAKV